MTIFRFRQNKLRKIKDTVKSANDKTEAQLARINELSKMARGTWFSLLGYLAFVGVTLLAVEDADFFISTRKTQLPIVNVAIPTSSFFIFGPILGTALFVYLHLYLIRLWEALSEAPAKIGTIPLSEKVMPWLINDFGLAFRKDDAFKGRPMDWVSHSVTFLLVFTAAPIVMGYFWMRHWPSHAALMNCFLAFLFSFTLITSIVSLHTAYSRFRADIKYAEKPNHKLAFIPFICIFTLTLVFSAIYAEGIVKTKDAQENPPQDAIYTFRNHPLPTTLNPLWNLNTVKFRFLSRYWRPFSLARAYLFENDLIGKPAGWLGFKDQKRGYRKIFCKDQGLSPAVCGPPPEQGQDAPVVQKPARQKWAEELGLTKAQQTEHFTKLEAQFQSDWLIEYKARIAALPDLNLQDLDLRNANAKQVFLVGADMRNVKLQGANLIWADLQGANLFRAELQGADLSESELQGTDLRKAKLQGADLRKAELQGAHIRGANLRGAKIGGANLQGADLRGAELQGAHIRGANLQGADLSEAELQGADLSWAELRGASLSAAGLRGANLHEAKLQEADLRGAELQGANLFRAELQGADLSWAELQGAILVRAKLKSVEWVGATIQSPAHSTDLRGSIGLTQVMVENVIGNLDTLLFASEGHPLYVWSCWEYPPTLYATIVKAIFGNDRFLARIQANEAFLCQHRPRVKTGTTKPLDAD